MDLENGCRRRTEETFCAADVQKDARNFPSKMATPPYRLFTKSDFARVFSKGKRYHLPALSLVVVPAVKGKVQFAIVVATTVTKRATQRNSIRRRLREHLRLLIPSFITGADFVVLARPPARTAERKKLLAMIDVLLRRAGILPPLDV